MSSAEPEIKEGIFNNNNKKTPEISELFLLKHYLVTFCSFSVLFFNFIAPSSLSSCLVNRVYKVDKDVSGLTHDHK